jgi:hypothetical protein
MTANPTGKEIPTKAFGLDWNLMCADPMGNAETLSI